MEICSVQQYLDIIEKLKRNYTYSVNTAQNPVFGQQTYTPRFIYRGHGNHADYKLIPGIFRWKQISSGSYSAEYSQLEHNILYDFISEACRFMPNIPVDNISKWLEVAQHFSVPTRLLDFTQNPLVALYFACSDLQNVQASVCIINESAYNKIFFGENALVSTTTSQHCVSKIIIDEIVQQDYLLHDNDSVYIQYPWIYKPDYLEERMNMQSSVFMLWGAKRQALTYFMKPEYWMLNENDPENKESGIICNILIPGDKKEQIIEQLNLCGVNEKFIYPGLDGVGRFIKKKYSARGGTT